MIHSCIHVCQSVDDYKMLHYHVTLYMSFIKVHQRCVSRLYMLVRQIKTWYGRNSRGRKNQNGQAYTTSKLRRTSFITLTRSECETDWKYYISSSVLVKHAASPVFFCLLRNNKEHPMLCCICSSVFVFLVIF